MRNFMRLGTAAVMATLIVTGVASASAGAATVVTRSGPTGNVENITTACRDNYLYTWNGPLGPLVVHQRTVSTPAPKVYGTGSAGQYVRFRPAIWNMTTNGMSVKPWAPWTGANASTPGTWSGSTTWTIDANNHTFATLLQVQWANASYTVTGDEWILSTSYLNWKTNNNLYVGSFNTTNGCSSLW